MSLRQEFVATTKLAVPLALSQLATMAIAITDVVMAGWLGPKYLAAEALATNYFVPFYFVGIGLAIAVSPIVAQAVAKGDEVGARRSLRQGLWVMILITPPFMLALAFGDPFLRFIGQNPALTVMTQDYLDYALWGTFPALGYLVLRNYLAAYSKPNIALVATVIAIPLNALGNYALMFGKLGFPRLELTGLGISTAITHTLIFLILLGYLLWTPKFREKQLFARFHRADWGRFREILTVGTPISAALVAETLFLSGLAFLIGLLGTLPLAAHAIAWQLVALSFMMFVGISQAATVRVGLAAGKNDKTGIRLAGISAAVLGLVVSLAWATSFVFFGREMAILFLDPNNPNTAETISLAVSFLLIGALFQLGDAMQVIALGLLRGLKDTAVPMVIAVGGYWLLGLPTGIVLGLVLDLGGVGIWAGAAMGLTAVGIGCSWRFYRRVRSS